MSLRSMHGFFRKHGMKEIKYKDIHIYRLYIIKYAYEKAQINISYVACITKSPTKKI
jgi:hypothetical protein